jgi:predicted metal-dependent hydrolase
MNYPFAYLSYLVEFHATRDYFECHELLEEYWKAQPKNDPFSDAWVGLIQIAVAQYHHRRGNRPGALKMFGQALLRLKEERLEQLGLDGRTLLSQIRVKYDGLSREEPGESFSDFNLPINDGKLINACMDKSREMGLDWGKVSRMEDDELIHRHSRRDRSDVVAARAASLEAKKRKPI